MWTTTYLRAHTQSFTWQDCLVNQVVIDLMWPTMLEIWPTRDLHRQCLCTWLYYFLPESPQVITIIWLLDHRSCGLRLWSATRSCRQNPVPVYDLIYVLSTRENLLVSYSTDMQHDADSTVLVRNGCTHSTWFWSTLFRGDAQSVGLACMHALVCLVMWSAALIA